MSTETSFAARPQPRPSIIRTNSASPSQPRRQPQANNALWRIATNRIRHDPPTIQYTRRRQTEGKTRPEIIRCLKRHIARDIYHLLTDPHPTPNGPDLRHHRTQARITLTHAADRLDTQPTVLSQLERGLHHLATRYQQ